MFVELSLNMESGIKAFGKPVQWNLDLTNLYITKSSVYRTIIILQPGQSYSKMYGTEPRYNGKISPVPWHFVKSRFHCTKKSPQGSVELTTAQSISKILKRSSTYMENYLKTHGRDLSCIPVSHLLVPAHYSSYHHAPEEGSYMSLFLCGNLPHMLHCTQTIRSIWYNYHRSLRMYEHASANFN